MSELTDRLELRRMRDTDLNLVRNSWVKSYAASSRDAKDYASGFADDYYPVVRDLIARSSVIVASLKTQPDSVFGWFAIEADALHYVLVKKRWRRMGVARWMLDAIATLPVVFTHRTRDAAKCPIPAEWTYRRFRIWPHADVVFNGSTTGFHPDSEGSTPSVRSNPPTEES